MTVCAKLTFAASGCLCTHACVHAGKKIFIHSFVHSADTTYVPGTVPGSGTKRCMKALSLENPLGLGRGRQAEKRFQVVG